MATARRVQAIERDRQRLADENRALRDVARREGFVGEAPPIEEMLELVRRAAPTGVNVLLRGESGVGKERVALLLHAFSDRAREPFVPLNCAALPETLLESELFGIEEGVATGVQRRHGKIELANGGTLFLDEVADLSLSLQAKLLRVVQEREFAAASRGYTFASHQQEVGAGYFDDVTTVIQGGASSGLTRSRKFPFTHGRSSIRISSAIPADLLQNAFRSTLSSTS